jgi:enoyl-CoA hydratase
MRDHYSGKYVTTKLKEHKGQKGVVVKIFNPNSKVQTVPMEALTEINQVLQELQKDSSTQFIVFYGDTNKIHAGADVNLFSGDVDLAAVREYLFEGIRMDLRIKEISRTRRTISIMQGERYGGSVEWPLMARHSVCTPDTTIQFSEVNIGLIPAWNGVLNVLLRSDKENALYLAATGNRITAQEMFESGLVLSICPDNEIMDEALDLATTDSPISKSNIKTLATREMVDQLISQGTDASRYRKLVEEVTIKLKTGELSRDRNQENYVSKYIGKRLAESGKPLAPLAVQSVFDLIDAHPKVHWEDFEAIKEMADHEGELCCQLMSTMDRKTGVNSILTKNPLEKIAVYTGEQKTFDKTARV